jgi:hypothetical protein
MMNLRNLRTNCHLGIFLIASIACGLTASRAIAQLPDVNDLLKQVGPKPGPPPALYRGLIGEYGAGDSIVIVLEDGGRLFVRRDKECHGLREL